MPKNLLENPIIIEYLMESPFYEVVDVLMKKYSLGAERQNELYDVTDAVIEGRLPLAELPKMIEQAFGMDTATAQKLAVDLAGHRLLPLELFFPEVGKQITDWGGKIEDYPKDRLTKTELSAEDIVKRLVGSLLDQQGLALPDPMKNRLAFLLQGYLSGERDAEATKKMLMRGVNIGGMELTEAVAGEVLQQVNAIRGTVDVVDEGHEETSDAARKVLGEDVKIEKKVIEGTFVTADGRREVVKEPEVIKVVEEEVRGASEYRKETSEAKIKTPIVNQKPVKKPAKSSALPVKSVTHALANEVPVISGSVLKEKEKTEVAEHAASVKVEQKTAKDKEYEAAADNAYGQLGGIVRGKRMKKSDFIALAVAHIRGLKDPLRTEEQLKNQHGFAEDQVDRAMEVLEKVRKEVQSSRPVKNKDEQTQRAKDSSSSAGAGVRAQEKEILDQRHAALTRRVSKEQVEPVMPNARVSAARSKEDELKAQSKKVNTKAVRAAETASKPKKAKVKVSQSTAAPAKEGVVVDIQYKKRLIGPVEQLGTMGTDEFRRLSSDASQAIQKILDQLDVLKEEDYGEYIEGVKAWRKSPMNQLYVQMTQQAMSQGIALTEVASQRRNKGEESLSPGEMQSLMQLNGQLAF
jgi:hypothetical protein